MKRWSLQGAAVVGSRYLLSSCVALFAWGGAVWGQETALSGAVPDRTREAYSQPLPDLPESDRASFFRGRSLFRQNWVVAPAQDVAVGLGPLYNRLSCAACHAKNGRGQAPLAGERLQGALVRLSVPGANPQGGPLPHPAYGDQFNEEGIPGVPGEGRVSVSWLTHVVTLADGTRVELRQPRLHFAELAYGPLEAPRGKGGRPLLTSLRVGQPVFGLGLLGAMPLPAVGAGSGPAAGSTGRANRVWGLEAQAPQPGRFGLKANQASLREQIAGAMLGDLGITSSLHPQENCTPAQTACQRAPSGGHPELTDAQLNDLETYLTWLAPPAPRHASAQVAERGAGLFAQTGCAACHWPTAQTTPQTTSQNGRFAALRPRQIEPYTDLLLHDMGAGLADGRPDFAATGREWRTPPLWGLGLTQLVNPEAGFLHDGRARTLQEAILWHGGQARAARQRYARLPASERETLLQFLAGL